ncbi:MAG: zinc ribbon domain-containing protein [Telluria sp.]|nr:zinc ribbon domain-containing protein [Telluria sp.]
MKDLGVREWTCKECGCLHNRDVNAAKNILRRGRATLEVGICVL